MKNCTWIIFLSLLFMTLLCQAQNKDEELGAPMDLKCEYRTNPLGVDIAFPRLSWKLDDPRRGAIQRAYRVLVASDSSLLKEGKANLWDSGKRRSADMNAEYKGKSLQSGQQYFWNVIVWDMKGRKHQSLYAAYFYTGLYELKDWKGEWISDDQDVNNLLAPYFRKDIEVKRKVKRAVAYICGLGYYELSLNGEKVGDHMLDPGYTRFDKTALYATYDVTTALKDGKNAIGVVLGNGWFNEQLKADWYFDRAPWRGRPRLLFNLDIEYENGEHYWVISNSEWKVGTGPIVFNNIYAGEKYDARLEQSGWNEIGFDDHNWKQATITSPIPGKLKSQIMPSIRITEKVKPVKFTKIDDKTYVYDFGHNFSGICDLHIQGERGTKVKICHGERLASNGQMDNRLIDQYFQFDQPDEEGQTDIYIVKGDGAEEYHPHFTYHGFRYVEVSSDKPIELKESDLEGWVMHTDLKQIGSFSCSNELLNGIWNATKWSYLSNLESIPTDCPHREKNGWTGDGHIACDFGLTNFDGILFYEKWIGDFADEQRNSGEVPGIIPTSGWGYSWGNGPAWDSGLLIIPWSLYKYYGDKTLIGRYYENYKRYVDYLTFRSKQNLVNIGLGDWVPWKTETPVELTSSCYYYQDALLLSKFSEMTGKQKEEDYYRKLAESIKNAINKKYLDRENAIYANGSQTSLSAAIYFGVVPEDLQNKVGDNLAKQVKRDGMDIGLLGSKYLLNALSMTQHSDVAYQLASNDKLPSWGWWIKNGATTLYEDWNGNNSQNHIMMGDISAWMLRELAGINYDIECPGYKKIIIRPHFVDGLVDVDGKTGSVYGTISSKWKKQGANITLDVIVPANTTAQVYLPIIKGKSVFEGNRELHENKTKGICYVGEMKDARVYEIVAGTYHFAIR